MNIYKPTEFRNHLFSALETVEKGEMVCIKTRKENLYIISEKQLEKLTHSSKTVLGGSKIPGRILSSLDDADKKLTEYIVLQK
jgi:PHD/YefM family antitoxin component YafN of YafNO toxin-antitoxin module